MKLSLQLFLSLIILLIQLNVLYAETNSNVRIHRINEYSIFDGEAWYGGALQFIYNENQCLTSIELLQDNEEVSGKLDLIYDSNNQLNKLNIYEVQQHHEDELIGHIDIEYENANPIHFTVYERYYGTTFYVLDYDAPQSSLQIQNYLSWIGLTDLINETISGVNFYDTSISNPDYSVLMDIVYSDQRIDHVRMSDDFTNAIVTTEYNSNHDLIRFTIELEGGVIFSDIHIHYTEGRITRVDVLDGMKTLIEYFEIEYLSR